MDKMRQNDDKVDMVDNRFKLGYILFWYFLVLAVFMFVLWGDGRSFSVTDIIVLFSWAIPAAVFSLWCYKEKWN